MCKYKSSLSLYIYLSYLIYSFTIFILYVIYGSFTVLTELSSEQEVPLDVIGISSLPEKKAREA